MHDDEERRPRAHALRAASGRARPRSSSRPKRAVAGALVTPSGCRERATPAPSAAARPPATWPAPSSRHRVATRRNGPARVFATMLVVPAIVGTVALPAYAIMPGAAGFEASGTFSLSMAEAQDVDVSALASGAPLSSDAYAVTTKAEIDEARHRGRGGASGYVGALSSPPRLGQLRGLHGQAEGDDYPWWNETARRLRRRPLAAALLLPRVRRLRRLAPQPRRRRHERTVEVGLVQPGLGQRVRVGRRVGAPRLADARASRSIGAVAWFPYNHVAYVQSINADGIGQHRGVQPELRPLVPSCGRSRPARRCTSTRRADRSTRSARVRRCRRRGETARFVGRLGQ